MTALEAERRVRIAADSDIVAARDEGRRVAATLNFSSSDLTVIATAISEVARNILSYAGSGDIELSRLEKNGRWGIAIVARDAGPGIADVRQALEDGYSTSGSLGLGLPGVRRLMDDFEIQSAPGHGTVVVLRKWARP